MVRPQSDVARRDIGPSNAHSMAVGLDVRVGRVGWVSYILWIAVCYQGHRQFSAVTTEVNFVIAQNSLAPSYWLQRSTH
jgi:hypothetical protein